MSCDICGSTKGELTLLLDCYRTEHIQHICFDCQQVVEDHQRKLRSATHNILVEWLKRFMENRRKK